jgi:hypothetical protein
MLGARCALVQAAAGDAREGLPASLSGGAGPFSDELYFAAVGKGCLSVRCEECIKNFEAIVSVRSAHWLAELIADLRACSAVIAACRGSAG